MTSAADLFALQEIDLRHDTRRALIADIETRLVETEELINAREGVTAAEAALDDLKRRQRDLDAQLQDLDAKVQPLEKKLYDGSVRNPKELTDLQHEVESFKKRRSALDDEGLSLLESVEAATRGLESARENLRQTEAGWRADQARLIEDKSRAEQESADLEQERELRTRSMERSALGLYEKLRQNKQGRAVAKLERGTCAGCRVGLPTQVAQRVRTGAELIQCPRCERILVGG
jgi:predicted  nucleic acid-binding Zn-ribbon protein